MNTFLKCGHAWFLAYVAAVKMKPNIKAVRGIAVHSAVEVDMRQKITSGVDIPVEDMLDAYDTSWNEETVDGLELGENDDPGDIKDRGYKLVKVYRRDVAPRIQPTIVEEPIQFKVNGQSFSGQIDLGQMVPRALYGDPDWALEIHDTKTTSRSPDPTQYLLNMTGYALGVRQATGAVEADTVFDYVVATTKPYYKEVRLGGPISDDQIRRFAGVVGKVSDAIKAEQFVPTGAMSGMCRYCGYKPICPYYMKEAFNG